MSNEVTLSQLRQDSNPMNCEVGFASTNGFIQLQRAAAMLANSGLVPAKDFAGNVAACGVALNMALRMGVDPLMLINNLHMIHNRPCLSSSFLIATVNASGKFDRIKFKETGIKGTETQGIIAYSTDRRTGNVLEGTEITLKLAKDEGWSTKTGSKWKTMAEQMLKYRAAAWWTRIYAPEISLGLHTQDELEDVYDAEKKSDGHYEVTSESLKQKMDKDVEIKNIDEVVEEKKVSTPRKVKSVQEPEVVPLPFIVPMTTTEINRIKIDGGFFEFRSSDDSGTFCQIFSAMNDEKRLEFVANNPNSCEMILDQLHDKPLVAKQILDLYGK